MGDYGGMFERYMKQAKNYCHGKFSISDASDINEIKAVKKTVLCYKGRENHPQCECTSNDKNKFHNIITAQQLQKPPTQMKISQQQTK